MDGFSDENCHDERDVELSSLSAIFPEIEVDQDDPHAFILDIPVNPSNAVTVSFPAPADGGTTPNPVVARAEAVANGIESHELTHLPSIRLRVSLPPGYPVEAAPHVSVSTSPPWLPREVVTGLENDATRLWEELGHDLVVFAYIDHVRVASDDVFGLVSKRGSLEVDSQHKIAVLDYDIKEKRRVFNGETFECGICLGMCLSTAAFEESL